MGVAPSRRLSVVVIICHCQLPRAGGGGGSCEAGEGSSQSLPRRERLPAERRARMSGELKGMLLLSVGGVLLTESGVAVAAAAAAAAATSAQSPAPPPTP